jgi:hypothetical protein
VGRFVVLQGVVDQMLAVLGEHYTVDLTSCTWLNELDALIDLREPCTHRSDGPLQLGIPTYRSSLVGKVPATLAPVLQVHIPKMAVAMLDQFDTSAVQSASISRGTRRLK